MRNPFKPTLGATPPLLAGRDEIIADFADALLDGQVPQGEPLSTPVPVAPARP